MLGTVAINPLSSAFPIISDPIHINPSTPYPLTLVQVIPEAQPTSPSPYVSEIASHPRHMPV
jgi:hypothetical protein